METNDKKKNNNVAAKQNIAELEKMLKLDRMLKTVFASFPTLDEVYHDGKEVFVSNCKEGLTVVRRDKKQNKTKTD